MIMRTINVADFAFSNSDSETLAKAFEHVQSFEEGAQIVFEKDKIYYIDQYSYRDGFHFHAAIFLQNASNIEIVGNNSTILLKAPLLGIALEHCDDIKIAGLKFDYYPKHSCLSQVMEINKEELSFKVKTDLRLDYDGDIFDADKVCFDFFGLPHYQFREHMYISKYVRLEEKNDEYYYDIYFKDDELIRKRIDIVQQNKLDFIVPVPNIAHSMGEAFNFSHCDNVVMKDCEIWSAPKFVFALKNNLGPLYFDNVNIRINPDSNDALVAWRDGYHCKDNRGSLNWNNCIIRNIHDDTFNISSTLLYVTEIISDDEIVISCSENGGAYYELLAGDELTVFNISTGKLTGRSLIKEVVKQEGALNHIKLSTPLPNLKLEDRVAFDNLAAPKSTITNCDITGTIRYRGEVTVRDTKFKLLLMWLQNETIFEGPIPRNILFDNCSFEGFYPEEGRFLREYVSVKTEMVGREIPEYKCENIVFRNCSLDRNDFYIEEGNSVIFE